MIKVYINNLLCEEGATLKIEGTEELDSASVVIKGITTPLDLQPMDKVNFKITENDSVVYEKQMLIDSWQENITRQVNVKTYNYSITLISETKDLETIPLPNLVITNDNELSVLDYIKRYNDIYGHYTINEQKFVEEGFVGETGSSATHESEIVSGAVTQQQLPLTINNGTRSDHFVLTLGNNSGEDVLVDLPQQIVNIGGYEVYFNAKKKALLKNTTTTITSENGQYIQKASGNYQFVKCDVNYKVADGTAYNFEYSNKQLIIPQNVTVTFIDNQARVSFTNTNDCIVNYTFTSSQGEFIPYSLTAGRYDGTGSGDIFLTELSGTINYTLTLSCNGYLPAVYNGSFNYTNKTFTFIVGEHIDHAYYSVDGVSYGNELSPGTNVITAYNNELYYYAEPSTGYYYQYDSTANHGTLNAGGTANIVGIIPGVFNIFYSGYHYSETASGTKPTSIIQGQSVNIDLTADNGYKFNTSNPPTTTNGMISNIQYGLSDSKLSFTLSNVNANTTVGIATKQTTFPITYLGSHISRATPTIIDLGDTITCYVEADSGYNITQVGQPTISGTVSGITGLGTGQVSFTLSNVISSTSIGITTEIVTYTLTRNYVEFVSGDILDTASSTIDAGTTINPTDYIRSFSGYRMVSYTPSSPFILNTNKTIVYSYEEDTPTVYHTLTLNYVEFSSGDVIDTTTVEIAHGTTVSPNTYKRTISGYTFVSMSPSSNFSMQSDNTIIYSYDKDKEWRPTGSESNQYSINIDYDTGIVGGDKTKFSYTIAREDEYYIFGSANCTDTADISITPTAKWVYKRTEIDVYGTNAYAVFERYVYE